MKKALVLALALALGLWSAAALAQPTAQNPVKWKAQTLWGAGEIPHKTFEALCENIKVMSAGRLIIEPYPAGGIVPTNETLDALTNNVLQVIHMWPGYAAARNPAFVPLTDFGFSFDDPIQMMTFFNYRGGMDLLSKLYAPFKGKTIGGMTWGQESYPSRVPITKFDDFKGLKIRLPQSMEVDIIKKTGANIINLPGTEIFPALDKGVVEVTNWSSIGVNESAGLHDIPAIKFTNYPGFHSMPYGDFTVNVDEWNKLPEDLKAIVETATWKWCWDSVMTIYLADLAALKKYREPGAKITITNPSEEEKNKFRAVAYETWQEWKTKNADSKKVIEAQEEFLREIGILKGNSLAR